MLANFHPILQMAKTMQKDQRYELLKIASFFLKECHKIHALKNIMISQDSECR